MHTTDEQLLQQLKANHDENLRDYQERYKQQIYEHWKTCRGVMLQMPTGTGKTRLFVSILKDIHLTSVKQSKQIKALILVHRIELIDQISRVLGQHYGLAHGIIHSSSREQKYMPFQIASVQTLHRRLEDWADVDFDFIIVDEAHHVKAESYKEIISVYPKAKLLGVTATPYRLSGIGFRPEFDVLVQADSISRFIQQGYLSDYDYFTVPQYAPLQAELDNIEERNIDGDYASNQVAKVCDKSPIRAQIVDTYIRLANGKRGIVFTINKEHNAHVCEAFCSRGIRAVAIDSDTDIKQRTKQIEEFRKGKITVLCNVDIFTEGFDCPDVEFVQLARPTLSMSLYLQQVGRGLRQSEKKGKTIFLDNVGLCHQFGLPSAPHFWPAYFEGTKLADGQSMKPDIENEAIKEDNQPNDSKDKYSEGHEQLSILYTEDDIVYLMSRMVSTVITYQTGVDAIFRMQQARCMAFEFEDYPCYKYVSYELKEQYLSGFFSTNYALFNEEIDHECKYAFFESICFPRTSKEGLDFPSKWPDEDVYIELNDELYASELAAMSDEEKNILLKKARKEFEKEVMKHISDKDKEIIEIYREIAKSTVSKVKTRRERIYLFNLYFEFIRKYPSKEENMIDNFKKFIKENQSTILL